jgi:short-subunit dehydrogenase
MSRVFIPGSADGLGRLAAQSLLLGGHEVVVHVRDDDRRTAVRELVERGAAVVAGDLADGQQTQVVARQVSGSGPVEAVIDNAGVNSGSRVLAVNVVAPYLLTRTSPAAGPAGLPEQHARRPALTSSAERTHLPDGAGDCFSVQLTPGL